MSREQRTVKVSPIPGEALRYRVESWTEGTEPHYVDLDCYNKYPECSCMHYKTRIKKNLEKGHALWTMPTMCRHIEAAYRYFATKQIKHISEIINEQK